MPQQWMKGTTNFTKMPLLLKYKQLYEILFNIIYVKKITKKNWLKKRRKVLEEKNSMAWFSEIQLFGPYFTECECSNKFFVLIQTFPQKLSSLHTLTLFLTPQ